MKILFKECKMHECVFVCQLYSWLFIRPIILAAAVMLWAKRQINSSVY